MGNVGVARMQEQFRMPTISTEIPQGVTKESEGNTATLFTACYFEWTGSVGTINY